MTILPLQYQGEGQFTVPKGFANHCDKMLVIGETLQWELHKQRSKKSHDHFFAIVDDAWANLPEKWAGEFPNPTCLRKFALIRAGYCDVVKISCSNEMESMLAVEGLRSLDGYRVVSMSGNVVTIYTAHSQSQKAMGAKRFQQSKDDVLRELSEMLGADVADLRNAA